jgi:hypothetical protein
MVNQAEEIVMEKDMDIPWTKTILQNMTLKKKMASKWINYVIRTIEIPEEGVIFATIQALMMATAPLDGEQLTTYVLQILLINVHG